LRSKRHGFRRLPAPTIEAYLAEARPGAAAWRKHGALGSYRFTGDDLAVPYGRGFTRLAGLKAGEAHCFPSSTTARGPTATASTRR